MNKKMRARKRRQARRVALTLVLMLTVALVSIGGTIAWLQSETAPVVNTFTVGDIDITLTETGAEYDETDEVYEKDFKMVPGNTISKDPKVTVLKGSEASWVFVKVEKSSVLDNYISYTVNTTTWTQLKDANGDDVVGVYYIEQPSLADATADAEYAVLTSNTVTVKNTVTKEMMAALEVTGATQPTLTFTAYAVQKDNLTVQQAWNVAQGLNPDGTPITA